MTEPRPQHGSQVRFPWPLRLWWFVAPAVCYLTAGLALLAGAALLLLAAFS